MYSEITGSRNTFAVSAGNNMHYFNAWHLAFAFTLFSAIPTHARTGDGFTCSVEYFGDLQRKTVTYQANGKIYALNGHARQAAQKKRWIDAMDVFKPEEVREMLNRGLSYC
jgi:hypothetical protein